MARTKQQAKKNAGEVVAKPRKKYRFKSGTRVLMDMRKIQKGSGIPVTQGKHKLFNKSTIRSLVSEILQDMGKGDYRVSQSAREAIAEAAADFGTVVFKRALSNQIHRGQKTCDLADFVYAKNTILNPHYDHAADATALMLGSGHRHKQQTTTTVDEKNTAVVETPSTAHVAED